MVVQRMISHPRTLAASLSLNTITLLSVALVRHDALLTLLSETSACHTFLALPKLRP